MRRGMLLPLLMLSLGALACGEPPPPAYPPAEDSVEPRSAGARPGWIDGRAGRYNDLQYLTAVGHGTSQPVCEGDAQAALAKVFKARIQQDSSDWQRYFSQVDGSGAGVKVEAMSITQLTRVSTDKVLKGVRLAEHWHDGRGGHHCLAVLERMPAARSLREEIMRLDEEIRGRVKAGDEAETPTARFMAYARAMELLQRREALNIDLRIVDPRGGGLQPSHGWQELVAKFQGAKSKIKVGLKLRGNKAAIVQTCLAEALVKEDIEVLEGTSDVDILIHGALRYEKAGFISGSTMVRADVTLRLNDVQNGRTVAAFADYIKVGRPTLKRAVQLSLTKLCQKTAPKLAQKIRASLGR